MKNYAYAAPAYLKRCGTPKHPSTLTKHECVQRINLRRESAWSFSNGVEQLDVVVKGKLALSNLETMNRVVSCGAGIAVLPEIVARENVRAGRLVRLLKPWSAAPIPVTAITSTRLLPAKTQAFIDFLRVGLADSQAEAS
jgi:DNA-binding transcriptional LysR family regulator